MKEFSSTLEAISNYIIVPELALLPTFKVPDREIIRAMNLFMAFADEAQERSRTSSDALKYASENWVVHLSRAPNPWDSSLNHIFQAFWNRHLLSWLERQWCLKGLRSCLDILSEGQKLAKFEPSTHRPNTTVLHVDTSRKRTLDESQLNSNNALELETSSSSSKRRK
ncbi:hypothetical protein BD769DRAFT_1411264 [Suillus cothurnatus]|nr:hypothetical protein BD769DRAFT_1411264 [Suillus cothurnatus]